MLWQSDRCIFISVAMAGPCCMQYIIPPYSRPSVENLFLSPICLWFLSGYLSCAFKCPSLLAFQQLLFLNASQKLLFAQRAWRDEKSDKEREKRKWMGNRGVREGKEDRGIYQDGRIEIEKQRLWVSGAKGQWHSAVWQAARWRGYIEDGENRGREEGREASWSLVLLQASVSTETTDWMNRKQGTGRRVCLTDMIPVLIFLYWCCLKRIFKHDHKISEIKPKFCNIPSYSLY